MALFTSKADANLPMLTRLYQVKPDLGSTADALMASETAEFMRWWLSDSKDDREPSEADIMKMARLLNIVRAMMDGAADKKPPAPKIQQEIQDYLDKYLKAPVLGFLADVDGTKTIVYYRGGYGEVTHARDAEIFDWMCKLIVQSLAIMWERAEFRRCGECKSVFVMKPGKTQVFCSTRCRHRSGQRRRMRELYKK